MRSPDLERADQLLPNRNEYADSNLHTKRKPSLWQACTTRGSTLFTTMPTA